MGRGIRSHGSQPYFRTISHQTVPTRQDDCCSRVILAPCQGEDSILLIIPRATAPCGLQSPAGCLQLGSSPIPAQHPQSNSRICPKSRESLPQTRLKQHNKFSKITRKSQDANIHPKARLIPRVGIHLICLSTPTTGGRTTRKYAVLLPISRHASGTDTD